MEIRHGTYRHYKNKNYAVLDCAIHTETGEELVIYRALYGKRQLWARPKRMFLETVVVAGREVPRFQYLGDADGEDAGSENSLDTPAPGNNLKP